MSIIHQSTEFLAQLPIPDPPAKELPGELGRKTSDVIGWAKTGFLAAALLGLIATATLMIVGLRGRSEIAKNAMGQLPYSILALVIFGSAYTVIESFT